MLGPGESIDDGAEPNVPRVAVGDWPMTILPEAVEETEEDMA